MNRELEEVITLLVKNMAGGEPREGLLATPRRYASFLQEVTTQPEFTPTVFDGEGYDEMVIQTGITFYSMCEHHLVPFFGTAVVAYVPDKKIIGLSKLARMVDFYSRQLQNQERITTQVADRLLDATQPKGVAVALRARHLCMEMRGIRKPGAETTTSVLRGVFKSNPQTRSEFLQFTRKD